VVLAWVGCVSVRFNRQRIAYNTYCQCTYHAGVIRESRVMELVYQWYGMHTQLLYNMRLVFMLHVSNVIGKRCSRSKWQVVAVRPGAASMLRNGNRKSQRLAGFPPQFEGDQIPQGGRRPEPAEEGDPQQLALEWDSSVQAPIPAPSTARQVVVQCVSCQMDTTFAESQQYGKNHAQGDVIVVVPRTGSA